MIKTKITELFSLEYPIFQGGMAWISDANLAAAVSNAGGLGTIAAGNAPSDYVRSQIQKAKSLTSKPFAVNVMLMSPFADEVSEMLCEEKPSVVVTGAGNPAKYAKKWLEAGIKLVPVVPSVAIAKLVERCGACAVVAEGGESGGHIGEITTMALVPQVCDAVSIPVVAAGGIGDGRGIAAAFALGAKGVQCGTRFLLANECSIHPEYKRRVVEAKDTGTIATGKRLGHPVRSLKTPFSREFWSKEYDSSVTDEQLESYGAGALKAAALNGDSQKGCFMAGQIAGLVSKQQPAADIIAEMFGEAEALIKGIGGLAL